MPARFLPGVRCDTVPSSSSAATSIDEEFSPLRWRGDCLELLDQTRLPAAEVWLRCTAPEEVAAAIRRLAVRGAPAIGIAAAYGLVLSTSGAESENLAEDFAAAARLLGSTRPTAVNLAWALERGRKVFAAAAPDGRDAARTALLEWARSVHADDIAANRAIGRHARALFAANDRVLTHCNAGALATGGYGTAIGVIRAAFEAGCVAQVWVDETRPLLQGSRLTAWELRRLGIPFRVVTDSSAGALISRGLVQKIVVGADRIARNGDTANKIGTYPLAVLAHRHGVPFYVAAPLSTLDADTATGADIPIEERAGAEITEWHGAQLAPEGATGMNFAFDVTPNELIAAIITEAGVLRAPFDATIAGALDTSGRR
jgi:methylthioribose-1-phosphate isomerase